MTTNPSWAFSWLLSSRIFFSAFIAFVGGQSFAVASAAADAAPSRHTFQVSHIDAAKLLMQAGRIDEAKKLIVMVREKDPRNPDALFLAGMIALSEGDNKQAVRYFHELLILKPDVARVRLEYARALFLDKQYNAAEREFRRARAGDLPPEVNTNIDKYLSAIRYLKTWNTNFSFAVAPDSNINAAPGLQQINIFGLPFQLSDDARKTSGVGMTIEAGGEYTPLLAERIKARVGMQLRRAEYPGGDFDDMLGTFYAGPKFIFPRAELSLLATAFRRDFGNSRYQQGWGGRLEGGYILSHTLFMSATAEMQDVSYASKYAPADRDGPVSALSLSVGYVLSPTSTLRVLGSVRRESAHAAPYANTGYYAALGYGQDLPYGFSTYVEGGFWRASYDDRMLAFGKARDDERKSLRLDIMNRRIEYAGFVPRISFTLADQDSNIPLYSYKRHSIEFGLVQLF